MKKWMAGAVFILACALATSVGAQPCTTWPYPLSNGTTADATQVMADLDYLAGCAAPLAAPTFTGPVGIGTPAPTGQLDVYAPSTNTGSNSYGVYLTGEQSTANTGGDYGAYIEPSFTAASGNTLATFEGIRATPQNTSSGAITTMRGVLGYPENTAAGAITTMVGVEGLPENTGAGAVTNMYGFEAEPENTGGGTVGNMFGVYANTVLGGASTASVTSMYGLYSRCQNDAASLTVTNCFALYLASPTVTGAITNVYGVYQHGQKARLTRRWP